MNDLIYKDYNDGHFYNIVQLVEQLNNKNNNI